MAEYNTLDDWRIAQGIDYKLEAFNDIYTGVYDSNNKLAQVYGVDNKLMYDSGSNDTKFYVNPNISSTDAAQATLSNLIESRYSFLKDKTTPLEDALFSYSTYNNPNLLQETQQSAIPLVQQAYTTERDVTNRAMASMGMGFDTTENTLRNKLLNLTSQESIANTASTIRNKIRDRELQIAYGASAGYSNTLGQTTS